VIPLSWPIPTNKLINHGHWVRQVTVVKDGITQLVQSTTPTLVYNGATPVIIDDTMVNGVIAMVDEGAIAATL
jgi:hypothetical protein